MATSTTASSTDPHRFTFDYEIDAANDRICVCGGHLCFPKSEFETRLREGGYLDFVLDCNHGGEVDGHQQVTGTLELEDYWESDPDQIRADIRAYIEGKL
jgi:hypothetical protein